MYRLDYAMWVMFKVPARTKKRLVIQPWRHRAVEQLLQHISFTTCIHQARLCRNGTPQSLPRAVFAALYMDAIRIDHALFRTLQRFNVNDTPFALKFRKHELVHYEYLGSDREGEVRHVKMMRHRNQADTDHFFARDRVDGQTLFDLCLQCAAEASDLEITTLMHCFRKQNCAFKSLQETRIALICMWKYEHAAQRKGRAYGRPPDLPVRKRVVKRAALFQGDAVPEHGVPAFGAWLLRLCTCVHLTQCGRSGSMRRLHRARFIVHTTIQDTQ